MTDFDACDAHDLAALLASGETTSSQLVEHYLRRIEQRNDELGAFITVTAESARSEAAAADTARAAGDERRFLGVPIAYKDLCNVAGVPTSFGSRASGSPIAEADSPVVAVSRAAGFIGLGKTNTPEFGLSSFTDNDLIGPARNPFDPERIAGGSSGGAAVAVAAGMAPLAWGSDGGGSIRIPSSCCGLFGLKPSRGRILPEGPSWAGLATDGPLARSVRDGRMLTELMAGPLSSVSGPQKIAVWTSGYLPGGHTDERIVELTLATAQNLQALGHDVVEIANPYPPEVEPSFNVIWSSQMAALGQPDEALIRPLTSYWLDRGRSHSAAELAGALSHVEMTMRGVLASLESFDAMVTPTLAMLPPTVNWFDTDPVEVHRRELLFTPFTALMNMSGQPAASLPQGFIDGLPAGVMIAAHPGRDDVVLSLAEQLLDR